MGRRRQGPVSASGSAWCSPGWNHRTESGTENRDPETREASWSASWPLTRLPHTGWAIKGLWGDSEPTANFLEERGLGRGGRAVRQEDSWDKGPILAMWGETPLRARRARGHSAPPTETGTCTSCIPQPGSHPFTLAHLAGQCGSGTYQRGQDAPALLVRAALREDPGVRAEQQRSRQHPDHGPASAGNQRAPPAPPAPPASPALPRPTPRARSLRHWPARATACALHSCRGSTAAGSAGEGMRGRGHAKGGEAPRLDPLPSKSWGG